MCDQKIIAAAAKNSGGLVIAQVKRLAANGSLPARSVAVPGPLVDCVVVVDKETSESKKFKYIHKGNIRRFRILQKDFCHILNQQ